MTIDDPENETVHRGRGLSAEEWESVRRRLVAAVRRLTPAWLAGERDDLVQAAWLRLIDLFREPSEPPTSSYIWRTAHSVVVDELRRARRRFEVPIVSEDDIGDLPHRDAAPDPEQRALGAELARHVRDCLLGLNDDRRRAVQLRLAGFDLPEIAGTLERNTKQVANLIFRGMEQLRACLRGKGVDA